MVDTKWCNHVEQEEITCTFMLSPLLFDFDLFLLQQLHVTLKSKAKSIAMAIVAPMILVGTAQVASN